MPSSNSATVAIINSNETRQTGSNFVKPTQTQVTSFVGGDIKASPLIDSAPQFSQNSSHPERNQVSHSQHISNGGHINTKMATGHYRVRYLQERGPQSDTFMQFLYMKKFGFLMFAFEILFIILFAIFVRYGEPANPLKSKPTDNPIGNFLHAHSEDSQMQKVQHPHLVENLNLTNATEIKKEEEASIVLENFYPMFQDIHVMMFIGFGFLMTFLKKYGYSSVGINFVLAAFVLQWAILMEGFYDLHHGKIELTITQLITSDFAAAAVLISMGALLGKLSPEQYIVMGFFEVVFYIGNEKIVFDLFKATDAGDSMTVHTFGAYFGLTVAAIMYRENAVGHSKEGATYTSDIFAMIGTVFLWVFWPSFNAALVPGDQRHRAVMNTYISLAACCLIAYAVSALLDHENKFNMVHVQNSTLAGGVAIGTSANLMIQPFGALLVGSIAAIISVVGYKYLTPFMANKLRIHDTCGVNNLHGMPGVFAAIVGAIVCCFASKDIYGENLHVVFPAMGEGRTANMQAAYQMAGLGVTIAMAIAGGLITGFILKIPCWIQLEKSSFFDDEDFWEVPAPEEVVVLEEGQMYMAKKEPNGESIGLEKIHHHQGHHYA